ncbi:hypothetical protein MP638_001189 [Amoeboaphelidium occidentale]|nr:hypothetical protein MP638_001189 [Amoeboaphelidium occidentale]
MSFMKIRRLAHGKDITMKRKTGSECYSCGSQYTADFNTLDCGHDICDKCSRSTIQNALSTGQWQNIKCCEYAYPDYVLEKVLNEKEAEIYRSWRHPERPKSVSKIMCHICFDEFSGNSTKKPDKMPCGHNICGSCQKDLADKSLKDVSLVPLRCCGRDFPQELVEKIFIVKSDKARYDSILKSKQRLRDPDMDLEYEENCLKSGFAICPSCGAGVERIDGCKNMLCRCGKAFCYNCEAARCRCGVNFGGYYPHIVKCKPKDHRYFRVLSNANNCSKCDKHSHYLYQCEQCHVLNCLRCRYLQ